MLAALPILLAALGATDYVGSAKMLDLDRAASEQEPLTKPETAGDDSATGEFAAVASPPPGDVTNTPSHNDLSELASRQGLK